MEEGLQLDPLNLPLKLQLDTTTNLILKDLLEGGRVAQHQWVVHCLDLWHVQALCLLSGGMCPPTMPIPCTATAMELGHWHCYNESCLAFTSRFSGWPGACHQSKYSAATCKAGSLLDPARLHSNQILDHAGRGREVLALPPPQPTQRISALPFSTPLHKLKSDTMLPTQLLTPFQVRAWCRRQIPTISTCCNPVWETGA